MDDFDSLFDIPVTFSGEKGDRGLRGEKGEKGDRGERGFDGKDGKDGLDGKDGRDGRDGKSIKGEKGEKGDKGDDGLSAYEIWLQEGNDGSEEDFLKSLKGKDAKQPMWHGNAFTDINELTDNNNIIANKVPYTGATADVDLGSQRLDTTGNMSAADPVAAQDVVTKQYLEDNNYITTRVDFTSQTSVTVSHNNGYYTSPTVVVSDDEYVPFNIEQTSTNAFTVTFSAATTGYLFYATSGVSSGSATAPNYRFVSTSQTITNTDDYVEVDTSGITVTLASGGTTGGAFPNFCHVDNSSGGDISVTPVGAAAATITLRAEEGSPFVYNGTVWRIK